MRNYNKESRDNDRKYVYDFDRDIIHEYMIKVFSPMFNKGNALELGSFQGEFTERLIEYFDDITCVEASSEAIEIASEKFNGSVKLFNGRFEEVNLPLKYDNIFLTHVLEHIDDRVGLLKKIRDEWMSDDGVFFIACPNANAPSRQIAVNMGLIEETTAVTDSEMKQGHRITYNMETLRKDISKSGLNIVYNSGIFFKAMANFQWDQAIAKKIISKEYLDACFKLGFKYPDLCSSVYFICSKF